MSLASPPFAGTQQGGKRFPPRFDAARVWSRSVRACAVPAIAIMAASCAAVPRSAIELETVVASSPLPAINGLAAGPDGLIYVASIARQSILAVDLDGQSATAVVNPPLGIADDVAFAPDGSMVFTAIVEGAVKRRSAAGTISTIATSLPGANSLAFSPDGKHLYVGQVFFGDGLSEIDLEGRTPPRTIVTDIGGPNAFAVGDDGMIYAPLFVKGQVARIDPATGKVTAIATGFERPSSVRITQDGRLLVMDGATGRLVMMNRDGSDQRDIARLPTGGDDMIIRENGHALVTNMPDSSLADVDLVTGQQTTLMAGELGFPFAIAAGQHQGRTEIYVAGGFAFHAVDGRTGQATDLARPLVSPLEAPTAVSVHGGHIVLASDLLNCIQIFDRSTRRFVRTIDGVAGPASAIERDDGTLLATLPASGQLLAISGEKRTVLASDLDKPLGLVDEAGGTVLITESGSGRLVRIDPETGTKTVIARDLGTPRTVAIAPGGTIYVLDTAERRLLALAPGATEARVAKDDLPIGLLMQPYSRSGGLAIGGDGYAYIASDVRNALYRIRLQD
ncbi:SMP-30/gluconolactonase/LRE family protein [Novosphingobium sp. PY1]|uniref:SMP-30/gluconolactonase/LRE family protein n=1 Tax=Novosphingobium sp. PY1 TaxID=1882221 RepID=UPI001A8F2C59|nr:SMP-30/gluconolactonase/LRE family protein [Novosphingobium sp. PY1]GFM30307.1 NHL repeat-containing protein [Novosphingobium sp. PY1]